MNFSLPYLVALHRVNGLGPKRLKLLLDVLKDPEEVWRIKLNDFKKFKIPVNIYKELELTRNKVNPDEYLDTIYKQKIKVKTIFDQDYPQSLKQIYDPPLVIYYKGHFPLLLTHIGVVGTRNITQYGRMVTEQFASFLAQMGLVVVSGLARGVDTVAHLATVNQQGKTIAVLGGGLNHIFPAENISLSEDIISCGGAIISEFPPDFPSLPGNFPSRNRIISGLSKAVLVTEAALDSGSLITAKQALEQGREVFAIPGPITSSVSMGTLELIKQGAHLVTTPEEMLEILGLDTIPNKKVELDKDLLDISELEKQILLILENESKHLDEICRILEKSAPIISAGLIKMEIKGLVKNLGQGSYIRSY